ncbi:hypothetical protein MTO96_010836 [Rhipicephalus appendiculatus]
MEMRGLGRHSGSESSPRHPSVGCGRACPAELVAASVLRHRVHTQAAKETVRHLSFSRLSNEKATLPEKVNTKTIVSQPTPHVGMATRMGRLEQMLLLSQWRRREPDGIGLGSLAPSSTLKLGTWRDPSRHRHKINTYQHGTALYTPYTPNCANDNVNTDKTSQLHANT